MRERVWPAPPGAGREMNPIILIILAILLAVFVTLVVPGGVLVAPLVLLGAIIWAIVRYVGARRDSSAAGPR